jgi:hypothetical protein
MAKSLTRHLTQPGHAGVLHRGFRFSVFVVPDPGMGVDMPEQSRPRLCIIFFDDCADPMGGNMKRVAEQMRNLHRYGTKSIPRGKNHPDKTVLAGLIFRGPDTPSRRTLSRDFRYSQTLKSST